MVVARDNLHRFMALTDMIGEKELDLLIDDLKELNNSPCGEKHDHDFVVHTVSYLKEKAEFYAGVDTIEGS